MTRTAAQGSLDPAGVEMSPPILSLVLCSRNDRYMGNSLWRLETVINYTALVAAGLGRTPQVEIVVTDWASDRPLVESVRLSDEAVRITSFVSVPAHLAAALQHDSPFPEVLALNAAVRRTRGLYIGRIDQDTLVGRQALEAFFDLYEGRRKLDAPLERALLFANRRAIPYRFASRCPSLGEVGAFVARFGSRLPVQKAEHKPFWQSVVGIWLLHRDLWAECGGYDERMIYLNDMEQNMAARLMRRHLLVDFGARAGHAFYHLEHKHPWDSRRAARNRKVNDRSFRSPEEVAANGPDWGLDGHALDVRQAAGVEPGRQIPWRPFAATSFGLRLLIVRLQMAGDDLMRSPAGRTALRASRTWRHRFDAALQAISGRSLAAWPGILGRLWAERGSRRAGMVQERDR